MLKKVAIIVLAFIAIGWAIYSIYKISISWAPDFSVLWLIAKDFFKTQNPYLNPNIYTPSGYPPFTYLLYLPLTFLSYKAAQTIFTLISFFSIFANVYLSLKLAFKKTNLYAFLLASGLALLSFPTKFTLGMGQINSIVLFLLLSSYFMYSKGKQSFSGIIIGMAIMLKPIFGFFLIFFLIKRSWKIIFYCFSTLALGFLTSLIIYGPSLWQYWIKDIVGPLMNFAGREVYYNQGFIGFISRLTDSIFLRELSLYLSVIFLITTVFYSLKKRNDLLSLSIFIVTLILMDSLSWQHHFVWLIFPFVLLSKYVLKIKEGWFWILLGLSYLLVSWNFKNPQIYSEFPKSLILSSGFCGAVILYLLNLYCLKKNIRS